MERNGSPLPLRVAVSGVCLLLALAALPGCDSGEQTGTTDSATGAPEANPATGPSQPSNPPTAETPEATSTTTDDWASSIAGKQIHVFLDASEGSTGGGGEVYISGGETYDIYLCTDRSFSGTYEDTTCVSVSVPGGGQSSCDGSSVQESYTGTWDVVMQQNIPYLALQIQGISDTFGFSLGSDGTTFYLDQVPATLSPNPYCQ